MAQNREFNSMFFNRLENQQIHKQYDDETQFYDLIAEGNIEKIKEIALGEKKADMYEDPMYGHLSDNPLQNAKYHVAISIALVTRYCITHGLDHELAYTLSDYYILKTDRLLNVMDVVKLHGEMLIDFTQHMAELPKHDVYSLRTIQAINYVCSHYTEDINVETVSEALDINRSYLSKIFKENTGKSLGDFIRIERLKAAANMLRFSDYTASQIAEYLHFSSQSHFIQCFKKEMGCTPAAYRNEVHPTIYPIIEKHSKNSTEAPDVTE